MTADRLEERDGKLYRVVTLPEVKRRKSLKAVITKAEARSRAIHRNATGKTRHRKIVTCASCHRPMPIRTIAKRINWKRKRLSFCGECVNRYASDEALLEQAK